MKSRGARGPWYITDTAVRKWLAVTGRADTPGLRDRAAVELERMAIETQSSDRKPRHIGQRALLYRGPAPHRPQLLVSTKVHPNGPLPQLIDVRPEHAGIHARKMGPRSAGAERGTNATAEVARAEGSAPMGPARRPEDRVTGPVEQEPAAPSIPRRGRGRPPKIGDGATESYTFRHTSDERKEWERKARAAKMDLSDWVRACLKGRG